MKNFLFATAAAFALMAAPVFACDTQPIAGSNATQKVDPNCQFATTGGNGSDAIVVAALKAYVEDLNS